ncbi:HEAT repeat domain-containing protein [Chitinimonas arctica]|uniref:HEAT repeat domain-containing protein n=1 Tax=Chitinimonas arctica TaxID=2594795 RepID=A0A516SJV9_9NEIS|nr:HEAT repeat domain-containing protein [Chitinimonas arctica]QDQ28441.1 HEAT repeat domain-containing protein [Chitinimonas arctica]
MDLLELKNQSDVGDIIDALYALGAKGKNAASPQLIQVLKGLAKHEDPAVREEVAACAGIRLRLAELYPVFLDRLRDEEDDVSVLPPLIDAVVALGIHGAGTCAEITKILSDYVFDEKEDDEVRGVAYLGVLKLWGKISPREYAVAPRVLSEMSWDAKLIRDLVD